MDVLLLHKKKNAPAFDVIVAGPRYHKTRGLKNKYDRRKPGTKTNTG